MDSYVGTLEAGAQECQLTFPIKATNKKYFSHKISKKSIGQSLTCWNNGYQY
jgi:hypothetical protein